MNVDPKEVAALAVAEIIRSSVSNVYDRFSSVLSLKRAQFLETFGKYSDHTFRKCNNVRTLYSKNAPMYLDEIYVKTRFEVGEEYENKKTFSDSELIKNFVNGQRIIVRGNGGSGKTIFLKHLWIARFKEAGNRIPIFIELRRLNDIQKIDISSFCRAELQLSSALTEQTFDALCNDGRFEFIFDGFDELARDKRRMVERQIIDLSDKFRKCSVLVSGREDDRFTSWSDFEVYSVAPLTLEEVKQLISKVPFDRNVKRKFLATLDRDFYHRHRSFLSIPLLSIMMLRNV